MKGRLAVGGSEWSLAGLPAGLAESQTYVCCCWSRWLEMPDHDNLHRITVNEGAIQWSIDDGHPWRIPAEDTTSAIVDWLLSQ